MNDFVGLETLYFVATGSKPASLNSINLYGVQNFEPLLAIRAAMPSFMAKLETLICSKP